jgi:hypothetical protein
MYEEDKTAAWAKMSTFGLSLRLALAGSDRLQHAMILCDWLWLVLLGFSTLGLGLRLAQSCFC